MAQAETRKSGGYALAGFALGLLLLAAAVDYQSSVAHVDWQKFLFESPDLNIFFGLILAIPTICGIIISAGRAKIQLLRRQIRNLSKERDKLLESRARAQLKTKELQGLLDQESGFFVDNWDELVTEKDKLREEAEVSAALLQVALDIGTLAGPKDVLTMLSGALPAALFSDDCLIFAWDAESKAFVSNDGTDIVLKPRSVKAVAQAQKSREPVTVEDVDAEGLFPKKIKDKLDAKSAILIPCLTRDRVTAIAMVVYRKAAHTFTPRDIQLASGIVSQARVVFENARLFEDVTDSRNELKRLLERLAAAQEEERRRFSRDLHDGVIQNLSGIIFSLSFLGNALDGDRDQAKAELAQLEAIVHETIADLRKVIYDLRPTILDSLGLAPTLEKHLQRFGEDNGVEIDYNPKLNGRLADLTETGLFRLAQETLNNIKKHAEAKKVALDIKRYKGTVIMTIKDDGRGFDMAEISKRASQDSGFGLSGMNERVQSLGGSVDISSVPGAGTQVKVTVPYEKKGA